MFKLRDLAFGYDHSDLLDAGAPPCLVDVHNAAVEACESKAALSAKAAFWRASLLPPSAATELAVTSLPLTADQQQKARDFSRVMGLDRKVQQSREAVVPDQPVPSEQVKANRMAAALVELLMLNMSGSTKKHQFEACSAGSESRLSQLYLSRLASFSHGTLTGALCAWRRYDLWCRSQIPATQVLPASDVQVALFLADVGTGTAAPSKRQKGGNAAVSAAKAGLKFLADHLGFMFSFDADLVAAAQPQQQKQAEHRAAPLIPRDLFLLEQHALSSNAVVRYMALAALTVLFGGVRFAHAQRSVLKTTQKEFTVFECSQGKTREGRAKASPFSWACPSASPRLPSMMQDFIEIWHSVLPGKPGFLVPAFTPVKAGLRNAVGFASIPMSTAQWSTVMQDLVSITPDSWPSRPVELPTSYSARRFMATISTILNIPLADRLALGSWKDDMSLHPSSGASKSMPVRYTDESVKMQQQVLVKTLLVRALKRLTSTLDMSLLPTATWDTITADMLGGSLAQLAQEPSVVVVDQLAHPAKERGFSSPNKARNLAVVPPPEPAHEEVSSSSNSSHSSSEDEIPGEDDPESLDWVLPQGIAARLHLVHEEKVSAFGGPRPRCCQLRKPPVDFGTGIQLARQRHQNPWCSKCSPSLYLAEVDDL